MVRPAPAPAPRRSPRSRAERAISLVVAIACLVGAGVLAYRALTAGQGGEGLRDLDGNVVVLDEEPDVAAAEPTALPEGPGSEGRFVAPEHGLDVPLVEMNIVRGVLNPPTLTDAFLVRGFGTPQDTGSGLVIVTMHAVRGGNAPGNAFFRMEETQSPVTVEAGDLLLVDGVEYVVTRTEVLDKDAVATSADVWGEPAQRDGELVVITCLQRAGTTGAAQDNLVVYAVRTDVAEQDAQAEQEAQAAGG